MAVLKKPFKIKMPYKDENARDSLSSHLAQLLSTINSSMNRPIIVVAIGTDRSTGDSLGPLVGNMLLSKNIEYSKFAVYGCLEEPVHAVNLENKLREIYDTYENPIIIAVDACLGKSNSIGNITLAEGPLKPGTGVKKQLPEVGQLHFTGIVNISGYMEYIVLQNTRLSIVMNMAEAISDIIEKGINKMYLTHRTVVP